MSESIQFSDKLSYYVARSAYTSGQLASLTGLPRTTIVNWLNGRVQRPRDWQSIVKLLAILHVNEGEANEVLEAAKQPTIPELLRLIDCEEDKVLLVSWKKPLGQLPSRSPFQVIADTPYFVGRQEILAQLMEQLLNPIGTPVCTIQGMAGAGKTVLAARLAYQLREYFPGGVLWARLDTSDTMTILHTFAQAYGVDVSRYTDLDSRSRVVRDLLADKQVLIVLDNVVDSKGVEPLLPPTGSGVVLITTRRHDLRVSRGANRFVLPPFSPNSTASQQLFGNFLGSEWVEAEEKSLAEIAKRVGHLPLALAIVAGRLAYEPDWTGQDFLNRLEQQSRRLKELQSEDQSIRRAFSQSYDLLGDEERPFFAILSLFSGEDFSPEAAAAATNTALVDAEDYLRTLYSLSLIQPGRTGRYQLHPLLRDYAREKLTGNSALLRMAVYFTALIQHHHLVDDSILIESSNILAIMDTLREQDEPAPIIELVIAYIPVLEIQGMYDVAEIHLQATFEVASDDQKLPILLHMTRIARRRRDYDIADGYLETAVILTDEKQDSNYLSAIHTEKGIIAGCRGDYVGARDYFYKGLPLARQHNDPAFLVPLLKELGATEVAHGNYEQAERYYQEALTLAQQTMFASIPMLMRCLGGVAIILHEDFDRAGAYYEEGLHMARTINNREDALLLLNNLALIAFQKGAIGKSETFLTDGLTLARSLFHQTGIGMILGNLGRLSAHGQKWEQAEQYMQEGLAEATAVSHHELIIAFHNSLGVLASLQQKFDEAESHFHKAFLHAHGIKLRSSIYRILQGWGWVYKQQLVSSQDSNFPKIYSDIASEYELSQNLEEFAASCKSQPVERLKIFYD